MQNFATIRPTATLVDATIGNIRWTDENSRDFVACCCHSQYRKFPKSAYKVYKVPLKYDM